jgi:hypothetical protein
MMISLIVEWSVDDIDNGLSRMWDPGPSWYIFHMISGGPKGSTETFDTCWNLNCFCEFGLMDFFS